MEKRICRCVLCGRTDLETMSPIIVSKPDLNADTEYGVCLKCFMSHARELIDLSKEFSGRDRTPDAASPLKDRNMTPSSIKAELDRYVIGQEYAKKVLSVGVYNHLKRITDTTGKIRKSNILLVGSSGCGKTYLAKTMAKILDVPFAIADATSLTQAGYVGDDVENILTRLLSAADGDVEKAQKGIVYIDEIDKIRRNSGNPSITRDVSGEGVQHALLKIIEGADVRVPAEGGRKHPNGDCVMINTDKILFICGGAFEGMLADRTEKRAGFGTGTEEAEKVELTQDVLIHYGMIPELVGRLPVLVRLDDLTEDDLVRILTEPVNCVCDDYRMLLKRDGVKLVFKEKALHEIARQAMEKKTGARGLRSIVEKLMLDIMYEVPDRHDIKECQITEDTLITGKPVYIKRRAA